MNMKLEDGATYRTANGEIVGPLGMFARNSFCIADRSTRDPRAWDSDGHCYTPDATQTIVECVKPAPGKVVASAGGAPPRRHSVLRAQLVVSALAGSALGLRPRESFPETVHRAILIADEALNQLAEPST
ncbi:MAG: hypothetical protein ACRDAJ_06895 [Serratia fonticola]